MNSSAVKFTVSLIINLSRPEIDQMKLDQLVGWLVGSLISSVMSALATEVYESPTGGSVAVGTQAPLSSLEPTL